MWFFTSPRLVFGPGSIEFLASLQARRALLICDRELARRGVPARVEEHLRTGGGDVRLFAEVDPEPKVSTVERALTAAKEFQPDVIVGLGGGSTLDVAKATYALYERPDLGLMDLHPLTDMTLGQRAILVGIPTTSGTGSEATWAVVLTEGEGGRKLELAHRELVPRWAILDPDLAATMPPKVTTDTAADALCHSVEAIASDWSNPFSDAYAKQAVEILMEELPRTTGAKGVPSPTRESLHYAATMGGLAFGNAQVGIAHAMAHALGSKFPVPHGRASGLFLPYSVEFNFDAARERYQKLRSALGAPHVASGHALADRIRTLWDQVGMSRTIPQALPISAPEFERALPELVSRADQSTCVSSNPRLPTTAELERLFRAAWNGTRVDF